MIILNKSKFPQCPICYKRHKLYPKKCCDILKFKDPKDIHPRTVLMVEYLKELREKFGIKEVIENDKPSEKAPIYKLKQRESILDQGIY